MTYKTAVEYFMETAESKNLSPNTIEFYEFTLRRLVESLPEGIEVEATTLQDLRRATSLLKNKVSLTTVNHVIRISRMLFKYLYVEDYTPKNLADRWEYVKAPKVVIKPFSPEQVIALLEAPDSTTFIGLRDICIMSLFADTGLRASECLGIKIPDIDMINNVVKVMGKGSKERVVPFGQNTKSWLRAYLRRRESLDDMEFEDPKLLFITEYGDEVTVYHMDHRLKRYGEKAGVTGVRVSNHTFRHFAAVTWLRNGGDLFSLQRLLGHSSLEMVRRYANYNDSDITSQHKRFSPLDRMADSGKVKMKPPKSDCKPTRKRIR